MNIARVSANGQIIIPAEIRRLLKIKEGDKLLFLQKHNGEITVNNSSLVALQEAQNSVEGNDFSEEEILAEVMALRYGKNK